MKKILLLSTAVLAISFVLQNKNLQAEDPNPLQSKISPKLISALQNKSTVGVPALIRLKAKADLSQAKSTTDLLARKQIMYRELTQTAMSSQADLVDLLKNRNLEYQQFYISNMIAVKNLKMSDLLLIGARNDVEQVFLNAPYKVDIPSIDSKKNSKSVMAIESSLVAIGVDKVWTQLGTQGEGIVIAGQDTGVQWDHPALVQQYRGKDGDLVDHNYNWHDAIHSNQGANSCGKDSEFPCDDGGHGTHTIATAVGGDGGVNQIGVAPKAKWIACRNMDDGFGTPSTYIECFEFFLAPYARGANPMTDGRPELAPHVINNSWGCPTSEGCTGPEFIPVLERLKDAGIMVVVSAGNEGPGCGSISSPPASNSELTLSVGAYDHKRNIIASFSSRGPSNLDGQVGPDVVAPGVNIRSATPGNQYQQQGWSGTSMAGPHVAGVVALMWSKNQNLVGNIDATTAILRNTAAPKTSSQICGGVLGSSIPNNTFGYGLVDAFKASQPQ